MPKKHAIYRYIVPSLIITISILFYVVMKNTKPDPALKEASERAWAVESIKIEKSAHRPVLQLYGQVITGFDVQLTSSIEADVIKRHANVGDTVIKGQRLLTLDKSRLEQIGLQRKAELDEIEALIESENLQLKTDNTLLKHETALLEITNNALKRAKTLEKSLMASNEQIDDAKRAQLQQKLAITRLKATIANHPTQMAQLVAKRQQAQTRLALAEDDIAKTEITSPINGVITSASVDDAEHINKNTPLFSISDSQNIEIRSLIPQSQYQLLYRTFKEQATSRVIGGEGIDNSNNGVNAKIESNNNQFSATLNRLPATINKGQAGSYAFFRLTNTKKQSNEKLLIGETVTILAELSPKKNSIALPHDAIYGTDTVFIIENERLKRTNVKWLGETFKNNKKYILIQSNDVVENDEILTSKFANAMHGLKVKTSSTNHLHNENVKEVKNAKK